jgi:hypothetical protein
MLQKLVVGVSIFTSGFDWIMVFNATFNNISAMP